MGDKVCHINVCGQISPYEEVCGEIDPFIRYCATFCEVGEDEELQVCDITFIDYATTRECTLSIDSFSVAGNLVTVNTSGAIGPVSYRFVKSDGTQVQGWSTDNTYEVSETANYFVQARDGFNCTDYENLGEITFTE